ncbi:helix-turn-helix transcriptional regulator [Lysinibacillus fusiformis]|uniref:helix-turn-helix transcriptional regulator n=1 Tax=Lysinibacillus fusiformis TaxID=28031 RepID=UPI0023A9DE96|nr:PAS domain-containing protein [Lysinibacillus fusiformis]WEA41247.1 PAS domain-containing protein [Lysinibacillus fusiformis]
MNRYVKFTKVDYMILESYKSVIEGLSEYLGQGYEFVLHSLEDIDNSAIKVINGHYTNRKEGAPLTDFAMKILTEIKKSGDNHKNFVYFNRNQKGVPIRSATFPITGENKQIIGLLCINFYMDISLSSFFDSFLKIDQANNDVQIVETFASNSDELILASTDQAKAEILNNPNISATNKNREIISILNQKGIFQLKDAVTQVASILGVSKNTVYLHLRNISNQ